MATDATDPGDRGDLDGPHPPAPETETGHRREARHSVGHCLLHRFRQDLEAHHLKMKGGGKWSRTSSISSLARFFWTFVGRYVRHLNFQEVVIADAIYFTVTGATFDRLCAEGLTSQTKSHPLRATLVLADGTEVPGGVVIPAQGPKFPWSAPTPWVKGKR